MLESDNSVTGLLRLDPDSRFNLVAMFLSRALPQTKSGEAAACTAGLKAFTTAEFQSLAPVAWLSKACLVSLRMEIRECLEDTDLELSNTVGVFVLDLHVDSQLVNLL